MAFYNYLGTSHSMFLFEKSKHLVKIDHSNINENPIIYPTCHDVLQSFEHGDLLSIINNNSNRARRPIFLSI
jgi:hypothetical protein